MVGNVYKSGNSSDVRGSNPNCRPQFGIVKLVETSRFNYPRDRLQGENDLMSHFFYLKIPIRRA